MREMHPYVIIVQADAAYPGLHRPAARFVVVGEPIFNEPFGRMWRDVRHDAPNLHANFDQRRGLKLQTPLNDLAW